MLLREQSYCSNVLAPSEHLEPWALALESSTPPLLKKGQCSQVHIGFQSDPTLHEWYKVSSMCVYCKQFPLVPFSSHAQRDTESNAGVKVEYRLIQGL